MATETYCLNCGQDLKSEDNFCPECGQKKNAYFLKFKDMISQFFITLFNLDSTFFNTMKLIITPWKLTENFVAGRRAYYYHPMRLFIVLLFLVYGFLSLVNKDWANLSIGLDDTLTAEDIEFKDSLQVILNNSTIALDQKNAILMKILKLKNLDKDTLEFSGIVLNSEETDYKLTYKDALTMEPEELFKKYKIHKFWDKIVLQQSIKLYKNNNNFLVYLRDNILWAVPLSIALLSFFMLLLYFRNQYYYLEHLVFLLHVHSALFILYILFIWTGYLIPAAHSPTSFTLLTGISLGVPYFALIKYYRQSFVKTALKYVLILLCYGVMLAVCTIFILLGSMLAF
ncbi:MAG: DUF3667 domain-containing protein [Saprospiraceae bacterium]|nr:DUF3667 domain-containing protein [Saprospiraceae bacterium]